MKVIGLIGLAIVASTAGDATAAPTANLASPVIENGLTTQIRCRTCHWVKAKSGRRVFHCFTITCGRQFKVLPGTSITK
jgi:hypothetical protein